MGYVIMIVQDDKDLDVYYVQSFDPTHSDVFYRVNLREETCNCRSFINGMRPYGRDKHANYLRNILRSKR